MELSKIIPTFDVGKLKQLERTPNREKEGTNTMTTRYNYFDAICEDVRNFIKWENIEINHDNREEMTDYLNDILFCDDSVTGNGSGSYTFNAWQAEENISHNWELIEEMAREFGYDMGELMQKGAEGVDVCIRCYLLGSCIENVIQDILYN